MIKFKNINGDVFLAVGSVKRKSALNGEKSLSATITQGDDVLNKIDKGWSLEFDNEPYVVTYFERNDNNNTVEIDAIHKFFWDMTKSVLYNSYSNSHVARFYLDEIFKDTGYTYALNFDPKAFEKENWGMKNKLSLFNDAISSMGAEFEINGTLISIFKNVGSDLSTIVRHGFNLSDMTLENDNANFATYGEGFGAYDDKENQKGPRLHVTYTSPLAKAFGKLHAEPIVDERYTVKDNLLSAVKDKVDSSFAVSVKLSLYDLTAAGYPYKMANVGDWLLAVDEHLDFKQKIRIISVDDEFAEDGTRISYTVTCGDVGVTKKYQDANAALTQKVQSAYENAQTAKDAAIQAVISATGKNTIYDNIDGEENLPKTANEGDLAFVQTGDGKAMYIYTKMPDGSFKWVKRLDPDTGEQIAAGVEEAIATANKHTDELNEKQASEAAAFQSEANVALSSAAAERADMFKQSTSMANSASAHADTVASSAAAYGKVQAASALSSANLELAKAKSDLTDGIASEASERQQAVATVNSQAQDYANQAKSDAIAAAETADGVIRTAISSSADSLSATITQNKSSADSGISTAQTTANAAVDGLAFKVSQTDYDQKTGDLSTKVNTVTQTATETKNELANVSKTVDSQSAQINTISNTVDGTTQTISDIQTEQGKQSGSIATLQSRADGFDATVTKVNNLSVGGRNLLLATSVARTGVGNNSTNGNFNAQGASWNLAGGKKVSDLYNQYGSSGYLTLSFDWVASGSTISGTFNPVWNNTHWGGLAIAGGINPSNTNTSGHYENTVSLRANGYSTGTATAIILRQDNLQGNITVTNMKLESGNVATDWSPAPEDVDSATAKAQLTADKATLDLSNYQKDANGRISKAQADITATSKEVSTKVSQSDFNTTTGDLTTKYGQVKATADAVTTDVSKYKTANDKKVSANSASINTLNNQITSKVSQTDFDKKTGDLSGKYSETKQTVDKISNTVTELQAKVNAQGQINQLMNTEFNPDTENWSLTADAGSKAPYKSFATYGSNGIGFYTVDAPANTFVRLAQTVILPNTRMSTDVMSLSWRVNTRRMDNYCHIWLVWQDEKGVSLGQNTMGNWNDTRLNQLNVLKWENISVPIEAKQVSVRFESREGTQAYIFQPMLTFEKVVGDYVQGNYNNNARVAAVEVSLDGITGLVNDPKKGLSATATLASNGLSVATKAQNDATTAIQTAKGVQTKVEQMGGINLLVNTEFNPDLEGWYVTTSGTIKEPYRSYWQPDTQATTVGWATQNGSSSSYARLRQDVQLSTTPGSGHQISMSWYSYTGQTDFYNNLWLKFYDNSGNVVADANQYANWADTNGHNPSKQNSWKVQNKWEGIDVPDTAVMVNVSFEAREGTSAYLAHPMLVMGSTIGDYVAGTYNNNNLVESVRTQLAGQITDEVNDRKNGDSTTRTQLTNLIDQRVTSVEKGYQSYFDQKADGILLGVGTPNMLVNSDFNPDLSGWSVDNFLGGKKPYRSYFDKTANKITVGFNTQSDNASMASLSQKVALASTPGARGTISLSWQARTSESAGTQTVSMSFVDSSGNTIGKSITADWSDKGNGWNIKKIEGIDIPDKATSLTIAFVASEKVTAYLTKPMLSFTNKAMPYMPGSATNSSTVLQLFKDNWSIGLADNLGKITSGIVADNNNMALINKNITLQGNTTVTADFYAKGGNFKNLNASNITTGTINAAKINVINLDVSSLSGNITNFVKSYWANAYSNVTIDGSGMTISNGWDHTNLVNGSVDLSHYSTITSVEEHIGGLSTVNDVRADNLDLISIYIDGYKNQGSGHSAKHGGDGFSVSLTNGNGNATMTDVLSWENELLAGARKNEPGWHFWDDVKFHQPVLITPPGAYQGILFSTTKMSSTTYPAIFGNQKKNDGPGIVMGSTELYFIYKGTAYPLSGILTNAYYDI